MNKYKVKVPFSINVACLASDPPKIIKYNPGQIVYGNPVLLLMGGESNQVSLSIGNVCPDAPLKKLAPPVPSSYLQLLISPTQAVNTMMTSSYNGKGNCDITKILHDLISAHKVALYKLKIAMRAHNASYIKTCKQEVNQSVANIRTEVLKYQKNCLENKKAQHSNFSLLGICFDQACKDAKNAEKIATLTANCERDNDSMDSIANCIQIGKENMGLTGSTSGSGSTAPKVDVNSIFKILQDFGIKIPGITDGGSTDPVNPPPPTQDQKTVLGMDPILGVGVIVVGTVALGWIILSIIKASSKAPAAQPAVA